MTEILLSNIANWMQTNPVLAVITCFAWGILSVGLSPCQLATVSILSTPNVVNSNVSHKIPKIMFGHAIALFLIGAVLVLFSFQMDFMGHYWTLPFGVLFVYLAKQLLHTKHCNHCNPHHTENNIINKILEKISKNSTSFIYFGLIYGILSSTCVLIYLSPILILAKHQNFGLVMACNAAFAIGHTLPILIVNILANSIHKLMCATDSIFTIPRLIAAFFFAIIGLILIAHPFLELAGFDFHGHNHEIHETSSQTGHSHQHHNHSHPSEHNAHEHNQHKIDNEHSQHKQHEHN